MTHGPARMLWGLFSLFVVYGTTLPFSFRLEPGYLAARVERINWHPLGMRNGDICTPDLLQNILLFIPFGFLGYISLHEKRSRLKKTALVLMGASLSAFVECLQIFSLTRWPAISDVIFNALGTAVGVGLGMALKTSVLGLKSAPRWRRLLDAPSAYPFLVFALLAVVGTWEPFDFALDVGAFKHKVKSLLRVPDFQLPNDELAVFIRFLLATLFACRLATELGLRRPALRAAAALAVCAVGLEATQIIIQSRSPSAQDAVTALLGVLGGGIAFGFPGFREHPWKWSAVGSLAVLASAVMAGFWPFRFHPGHGGINWLPFLSEYSGSAFAALSNFLGNAMLFFPLGFLLGYFFPGSRRAPMVALVLALVMSIGVEVGQGLVEGRHSDITDVIGALTGCLAGSLALTRGWRAYRGYVAERPTPI
ncbi:MAG TPA: VanZ family protein [Fibrobacteria bacterium]|nr:VanZ family protein [Fibrobacteria bacterium]